MEVKCIMKLIRSCIVSFSMYSKIPMPQFKWNDDDMKYMLVFFPWIGAVIGLLLMLWRYIYSHFGVTDICYVCIGALIPIAVTGGFHIDGFKSIHFIIRILMPAESGMPWNWQKTSRQSVTS